MMIMEIEMAVHMDGSLFTEGDRVRSVRVGSLDVFDGYVSDYYISGKRKLVYIVKHSKGGYNVERDPEELILIPVKDKPENV